MPRSGVEARRRLQVAALELFADHGFDATTAAQIAARAGVTERTFFRHFPVKSEVLFSGQQDVADALAQAVADAPRDLSPFETARWALLHCDQVLVDDRDLTVQRWRVISSHEALQERYAAKAAAMGKRLGAALFERGVPLSVATLTGQAAWSAFHHAMETWLETPGQELRTCIEQSMSDLQASGI